MNELDKKILELFRYLIGSGTKHLRSIDYKEHKLRYIVNCKEITLHLKQYVKDREVKPNTYSTIGSVFDPTKWRMLPWYEFGNISESEVGYELIIEGKTYTVPKLQRVEQAQVLDRIEATLEEKESDILNSVLDELTSESREEL